MCGLEKNVFYFDDSADLNYTAAQVSAYIFSIWNDSHSPSKWISG